MISMMPLDHLNPSAAPTTKITLSHPTSIPQKPRMTFPDQDIGTLWTACEEHGATMAQLKHSLLSLAATIPPGSPPSTSGVRADRSLEGARRLFRTLESIATNLLAGGTPTICTAAKEKEEVLVKTPAPSGPTTTPTPAAPHKSVATISSKPTSRSHSLPPSTARRFPKYTTDPRRWTLEATYTYNNGHWYCNHPRCAFANSRPARPRSRRFGVYAAQEGAASSIMRRAREHTLKHEREDLESARKMSPVGGDGEEEEEEEEEEVEMEEMEEDGEGAGSASPGQDTEEDELPDVKPVLERKLPRYYSMDLSEGHRYQLSETRKSCEAMSPESVTPSIA